jgi:hypothetical protein
MSILSVLVIFVEPASERAASRRDARRFWASFGAWQDDRSEGSPRLRKSARMESS